LSVTAVGGIAAVVPAIALLPVRTISTLLSGGLL
jgi:hypothetical protein